MLDGLGSDFDVDLGFLPSVAVLLRIMLPVEASSPEVSVVTVGASYPVLLTTRPPIKVGLDGGPILDSF